MNGTLKLFSSLFLGVLLTACVTGVDNKMPEFELKKGSKIGIYVSIPEQVVHLHSEPVYQRNTIGTSQNEPRESFVGLSFKQIKTSDIEFDFYRYAVRKAKELLNAQGFEGVELNATGLGRAGFTISDFYAKSKSERTLVDKLGLSAIISIEESEQTFAVPCVRQTSCESFVSPHPVLQTQENRLSRSYSRVFLPVTNSVFIFDLDQAIYLEPIESVKRFEKLQQIRLQTRNVKRMGDEDLAKIGQQFERLISANLTNSVESLLPDSKVEIVR